MVITDATMTLSTSTGCINAGEYVKFCKILVNSSSQVLCSGSWVFGPTVLPT